MTWLMVARNEKGVKAGDATMNWLCASHIYRERGLVPVLALPVSLVCCPPSCDPKATYKRVNWDQLAR